MLFRSLASRGIIDDDDTDLNAPNKADVLTDTVSGVIADIRSAVISGTTQYFLLLEGGEDYFQLSAGDLPLAVLLNVGDSVEISFYPAAGGVSLPAFDVKLDQAGTPFRTSPVQSAPEDSAPAEAITGVREPAA